MKQLKAIFIDPIKKTVSEIQMDSGLLSMYKLLDCDTVTLVYIDNENAIWLDDEGRIRKDPKDGFMLKGYDAPLAGYGLVLGCTPSGKNKDTILTVAEVEANIAAWVPKESFPPPVTKMIFW